jgi:hypothetical protein
MLNTYIKNQGITKTIIHDNNHNHINQVKWDADYNGDIANLSVDTNTDGKRKHFDFSLDNQDLANILNIQSVNMPIDKRLKMDFQEPYYNTESLYIELPTPKIESRKPEYHEKDIVRRISSPLNGEELIIPLTINEINRNSSTLKHHKKHKKHRRPKSHITHRVYKKNKSTSSKHRSKSKSRNRTLGRKTTSAINLF